MGYKFDVAQSTSLYGVLAIAYDDVGFGNLSESDTGYLVNAGVRHAFGKSFEIDAYVQHVDIWGDTDQSYTLSGKYYINSAWAVQAGYTHVDGDNSLMTIGASYNF